MCGICGLLDPDAAAGQRRHSLLARMMMSLARRGPDDEDAWHDGSAGIALGHRRLAVIDLTPTGRQPMVSSCGRIALTYNGEIYNFHELRRELEATGRRFRGTSDAEVLVEALAEWGLARATRRLEGIFAFAAWDRHERRLHLVRDSLGVKPLYWARAGAAIIFASELGALRADPRWSREIDRDALLLYLRLGYVPAPRTIHKGASKVGAGAILTFEESGGAPATEIYWAAKDAASAAVEDRGDAAMLSDEEAADRLDALLFDAVGAQMVADAPVGAFLSGGIDSSAIVAMMARHSSRPVRTFSVGFDDRAFDESPWARRVARHLGTEHRDIVARPEDALAVVPHLPDIYDEPFADPSAIPTFLVSRLARTEVTVALSGDGGDEMFAGYNRYVWAPTLWRFLAPVPGSVRRTGAAALAAAATWGRKRELVGEAGLIKAAKVAEILPLASMDAVYRRLLSQWTDPLRLLSSEGGGLGDSGAEPRSVLDEALAAGLRDPVDRMRLADIVSYLPDDILTKVDRASMAVGLEVRVPFLDRRVFDFAWRLPRRQMLHRGTGKRLLRKVLHRYVPPELVERPKTGFGVPVGVWLRGPLREWAEDLLDEQRLREGGLLCVAPVRKAWQEHLEGTRDRQYPLWTILMLESWRRRQEADGVGSRQADMTAAARA